MRIGKEEALFSISLKQKSPHRSLLKLIQFNDQTVLAIDETQVDSLVKTVCDLECLYGDEIYLNFVTKDQIIQLHTDHFNDPTPTDCITFPLDGPQIRKNTPNFDLDSQNSNDPPQPVKEAAPHIVGESFVCPQVALEVCPQNPYEELTLYIVHTLLHLAGYNDLQEQDIQQMRAAEKRILAHLNEKNLVLSQPMVL